MLPRLYNSSYDSFFLNIDKFLLVGDNEYNDWEHCYKFLNFATEYYITLGNTDTIWTSGRIVDNLINAEDDGYGYGGFQFGLGTVGNQYEESDLGFNSPGSVALSENEFEKIYSEIYDNFIYKSKFETGYWGLFSLESGTTTYPGVQGLVRKIGGWEPSVNSKLGKPILIETGFRDNTTEDVNYKNYFNYEYDGYTFLSGEECGIQLSFGSNIDDFVNTKDYFIKKLVFGFVKSSVSGENADVGDISLGVIITSELRENGSAISFKASTVLNYEIVGEEEFIVYSDSSTGHSVGLIKEVFVDINPLTSEIPRILELDGGNKGLWKELVFTFSTTAPSPTKKESFTLKIPGFPTNFYDNYDVKFVCFYDYATPNEQIVDCYPFFNEAVIYLPVLFTNPFSESDRGQKFLEPTTVQSFSPVDWKEIFRKQYSLDFYKIYYYYPSDDNIKRDAFPEIFFNKSLYNDGMVLNIKCSGNGDFEDIGTIPFINYYGEVEEEDLGYGYGSVDPEGRLVAEINYAFSGKVLDLEKESIIFKKCISQVNPVYLENFKNFINDGINSEVEVNEKGFRVFTFPGLYHLTSNLTLSSDSDTKKDIHLEMWYSKNDNPNKKETRSSGYTLYGQSADFINELITFEGIKNLNFSSGSSIKKFFFGITRQEFDITLTSFPTDTIVEGTMVVLTDSGFNYWVILNGEVILSGNESFTPFGISLVGPYLERQRLEEFGENQTVISYESYHCQISGNGLLTLNKTNFGTDLYKSIDTFQSKFVFFLSTDSVINDVQLFVPSMTNIFPLPQEVIKVECPPLSSANNLNAVNALTLKP